MSESANSYAPSNYLSLMQWARNYALAYLDENMRSDQEYVNFVRDYLNFAKQNTPLVLDILAKNIKEDGNLPTIADLDFYIVELEKSMWHLDADMSFRDSFETNILWAARNSIIYILALITYKEIKNTYFTESDIDTSDYKSLINGTTQYLLEKGIFTRVVHNMLFIKPLKADRMPNSVDGYSIDLLEDITSGRIEGMTLPASASTC